jgi:hypothetical protein
MFMAEHTNRECVADAAAEVCGFGLALCGIAHKLLCRRRTPVREK